MASFLKFTSKKALFWFSLLMGLFIIYPNIAQIPWDLSRMASEDILPHAASTQKIRFYSFNGLTDYWLFFIFRYLFFCLTSWVLLTLNIRRIKEPLFTKRFVETLVATLLAYGLYILISLFFGKHVDCFTIHLVFQFFVACIICVLIGYVIALYALQREKEQEIERLKSETLQSRCDALTNQINPHFFFNSLNSLTYLIRGDDKARTLEYVNKLSGVFRFILQSDKKGIVALEEELNFLDSFRYLMEVRFSNKLTFHIEVGEDVRQKKLPVLSLLPLIDNVVTHNAIDSEHKMEISIVSKKEPTMGGEMLVVSNPIFPKLEKPVTNGTGLANLSARFRLLVHKDIRIEKAENSFCVTLPLT